MEIEYVKGTTLLEFKNLDIGDCFIFDNSVYMKTEDVESLETHCRQAKCI